MSSKTEIQDGSDDGTDNNDANPIKDPFFGITFGIDGCQEGYKIGHNKCWYKDKKQNKWIGSTYYDLFSSCYLWLCLHYLINI